MEKNIAIEVQHLKKSYGKKEVLKDITLEVYQGELFGFVGVNGIGKSTTIDCMIGVKKFDDGEILLNGFDIVHDPISAKKQFGYVASEPDCYEVMTGYNYLSFIAGVYKVDKNYFLEKCHYLLEKLQLKESDLHLPIMSYSHGMKQKICIIASLIHNPKIWILDEPTVGLDILSVEALNEIMKDYVKEGNTIFLTSHNIDLVADICDRVAIINKGYVVKTKDLRENPKSRKTLKKEFLAIYQDDPIEKPNDGEGNK